MVCDDDGSRHSHKSQVEPIHETYDELSQPTIQHPLYPNELHPSHIDDDNITEPKGRSRGRPPFNGSDTHIQISLITGTEAFKKLDEEDARIR